MAHSVNSRQHATDLRYYEKINNIYWKQATARNDGSWNQFLLRATTMYEQKNTSTLTSNISVSISSNNIKTTILVFR